MYIDSHTVLPYQVGPGLAPQDAVTLSTYGTASPNAATATLQVPGAAGAPNYLTWLLGIVIVLAVLKYASQHERSRMDPKIVGIGVYNIVAVGLMATLFLVVAKTLLAKYPIRGLSTVVGAA